MKSEIEKAGEDEALELLENPQYRKVYILGFISGARKLIDLGDEKYGRTTHDAAGRYREIEVGDLLKLVEGE